jgi:hypothetical protein
VTLNVHSAESNRAKTQTDRSSANVSNDVLGFEAVDLARRGVVAVLEQHLIHLFVGYLG